LKLHRLTKRAPCRAMSSRINDVKKTRGRDGAICKQRESACLIARID
jgi:hypothetical protein